ncbi:MULTISPECIES: glycosyltransferase family 2 protein [Bacillus]|uniref:glycosyltransferase family 2 protein n=1 Tax=Bacillus TaxID=1386 RepID=UPI000381F262|nr:MULTISPECIES: glycosyltransferase [Bacillus]PEJ37285.1 glycosyltransferase family 2 protein [Bacillus pseudomycoides]PEP51858.1 glycosyltransferase family 2 protein [Bacillus pseudomycoides]PGS09452.1 glycosyltransferase family 2 protein [Bacillus pseudomycoides]PHA98389.1 glycosyltransferase family 2 protein [Bacillus pseudomycoides]PHC78291.1 glycosyltransferase family 2 protein [Bacillus pseudomycoides]
MEFLNSKVVTVLLGVFFVITLYVNINTIYYVILSLFGFGRAKRDYELVEDKTKFLILVAAHNEEKVIGSTIDNLNKIQYRDDLYDIYIVNDNSTDRTGDICEEKGMKYVNTSEQLFPREGVGKPAGLQYALRYLGFEELIKKYDCLMILDADNHVDSNVLQELNSQYIAKEKPEAIQIYLDSKNSATNLSLGYAMSYYLTNRFFQLAKYRVGLPNAIGGTGFIVKMEYLMKHGGFCFVSLTEDLELEMEIVKDNGRVLWNHFVRVYDEKPDNFKVSIKQRTRWSQGHWYVAFTNFKPMMKKLFTEKGKLKIIDQLFYLFGMTRAVQMTITLIGILIAFGYVVVTKSYQDIPSIGKRLVAMILGASIISLILFTYQFVVCMYYAVKIDTNRKYQLVQMSFSIFYYAYTFIYAQIVGLIKWKQQHTWVKTEHNKTSINHKKDK